MPFQPNPFTEVYQTIRTGLLAYAPFAALVKDKNFRDATDPTFNRFRDEIAPSDTPEIILVQGKRELKPFGRNSQVADFSLSYPIIATFDSTLRVVPVNDVIYAGFIAMLKLGDDLGLPYVRSWDIAAAGDDPFGQQEWKRGAMRYLSLLQINVEMYQSRQTLKNL